jgi:uncharacterized integral membrane protein
MRDDENPRDERIGVEATEESRSLFGQIRLWLGLIGAGLPVLFLVQNLDEVDVDFLWFEWQVPMIAALIAAAVLGALTSMLLGFFRRRGQEARVRAEVAAERARERKRKDQG